MPENALFGLREICYNFSQKGSHVSWVLTDSLFQQLKSRKVESMDMIIDKWERAEETKGRRWEGVGGTEEELEEQELEQELEQE